jgi:hypothetical protein
MTRNRRRQQLAETLASSILPCAAIIVATCLLPRAVTAQEISTAVSPDSSYPFELTMELQQATYRVGDSIKARLTLRNSSSQPVKIIEPRPTLAEVRVIDAGGRTVAPTVLGEIEIGRGWVYVMDPHELLVLGKSSGREWISLSSWGYDLRAPGTYTILGFPPRSFGFPPVSRDWSRDEPAQLKVTVMP